MCDYADYLERKARNEGISRGKKLERKENNRKLISNLMSSLNISFSKATELLKVSKSEVKEIEKYFQS